MEAFLLVSTISLWIVLLINLGLTLRLVRYTIGVKEGEARWVQFAVEEQKLRDMGELEIGAAAPDFRAKTLTGEVVSLEEYAGRGLLLIFSSPSCAKCRLEMPVYLQLAPFARSRANTEIVIVSGASLLETRDWIHEIERLDNLKITLPVLVAPPNFSSFLMEYNRAGVYPYFCAVDEQGKLYGRGGVGDLGWHQLLRSWEGEKRIEEKPFMMRLNQYR
jgi:thiol-disulfide isomerase/thioredoxin